jgi:hypothetical protein
MTKLIMREKKNGVEFRTLEVGDCFLDKDGIFCIKVNSTTCLFANDVLTGGWEECDDCESFEEVFPVDVEIHIVS